MVIELKILFYLPQTSVIGIEEKLEERIKAIELTHNNNMKNKGIIILLFALTACPSKENVKIEPKKHDAIIYHKFCMPKSCFIKVENDSTIYYPYQLADSLIPLRDSSYKIKLSYKVSNEPFIINGLCNVKYTQIQVLTISKK